MLKLVSGRITLRDDVIAYMRINIQEQLDGFA
jgi:hypothetical protein